MKNKKIFFPLLAFIGGLFITLLVLEIALRLLGFGNLVIYQYDKDVYWKPKPDQHCFTKEGHQPVHINRFGFRGEEINIDKPKSVFRILSLGDSRTFGWGVSDDQTYSQVLEKELSRRTGKKIEVLNAGVNAYSYPQMYTCFLDVSRRMDIDLVIVGCANWWDAFLPDAPPEYRQEWKWRIVLKNFLRRSALYHALLEAKLNRYYVKWRRKFIPVSPQDVENFMQSDYFLQKLKNVSSESLKKEGYNDPSFLIAEEYLHKIVEFSEQKGIPCIFLYLPYGWQGSNNIDFKLKRKALVPYSGRIQLVDATCILRPPAKSEAEIFFLPGDPVHLSAIGNKIVGIYLADQIMKSNYFDD